MVETPFFSIVTPTYNRAHYLEEMICSVQAQQFSDYEHIIVDDGSQDRTESLVKNFADSDSRIVYQKQENRGRSTARNVGIGMAKGKYICFLDSDDVWLSEHLQVLQQTIKTTDRPALYHTGLIWFYEDATEEKKRIYDKRELFISDVEYAISNEFAPDCVCVEASLMKKNLFNPELFINEDVEVFARIAAANPVVTINRFTAKLRVHDENTSKVVKDDITPRIIAFQTMLQNPSIRKQVSSKFEKRKMRGFRELLIRHHEAHSNRWSQLLETILFLLKHPNTPRNKAKLVSVLYLLPGGPIIKRLKQG
jgi:glycosyltransferase involved in cell wall biosynthesis